MPLCLQELFILSLYPLSPRSAQSSSILIIMTLLYYSPRIHIMLLCSHWTCCCTQWLCVCVPASLPIHKIWVHNEDNGIPRCLTYSAVGGASLCLTHSLPRSALPTHCLLLCMLLRPSHYKLRDIIHSWRERAGVCTCRANEQHTPALKRQRHDDDIPQKLWMALHLQLMLG